MKLIDAFWTLKGEKYHYGIVEVIEGEDLSQSRVTKKYETHIERALEYTMKNKILSHMSIQTYSSFLKERPGREDWEKKYYPFVLEFEGDGKEYFDAIYEATVYVQFLITDLNIHRDDILIMINNSRSIYVSVNPKAFNARPDKDLNLIYAEIYRKIKAAIGLIHVDESIVTSTYKLMKTPNCYYKGGYFVPIEITELMNLMIGATTKDELTNTRRPLDKEVPSQLALNFIKLYSAAVKKVKSKGYVEEGPLEAKPCGTCIKYLMQHMIEKGHRNYGLISVGIYLKSIGYTKDEVYENLVQLASSWNHDESQRNIRSKVNTLFRKNYNFSCSYAQAVYQDLGIETMCQACPRNIINRQMVKVDAVQIDANIINELWSNKASTRHYLLYLQILDKDLLNIIFKPEDYEIKERTLKELCKLCSLKIKNHGDKIEIKYTASKKRYILPRAFIKTSSVELGEYIKHYLKLFVKGYKAVAKFMFIRLSMENIMKLLDYTDISSVYKLINKLKTLGLIKEKNTCDYCLFYESYKIIELDATKAHEQDDQVASEILNEVYKAVAGEQLSINFENNKIIFNSNSIRDKYFSRKKLRGSPGSAGGSSGSS
ncbi:hypothetical protein IAI10_16370 [Clostridium sp. 19966]|uniref:hypothetical protein n=1 Tax=Clostridium sp. 19966 TaxID=2768166 RepID=UPI0028DDD0B1|nr:hypothetical protein [Clostridium sp. 19966]MDT8718243.1 hypothetical protein [Clostridium sp. 19966]